MYGFSLCRLEGLLQEKLKVVDKVGGSNTGFAAAQIRLDAHRQVSSRTHKNATHQRSNHCRAAYHLHGCAMYPSIPVYW